MRIVMTFDFPDKEYKRITSKDLHANDILNEINDEARICDWPKDVWHFQDEDQIRLVAHIGALYAELYQGGQSAS